MTNGNEPIEIAYDEHGGVLQGVALENIRQTKAMVGLTKREYFAAMAVADMTITPEMVSQIVGKGIVGQKQVSITALKMWIEAEAILKVMAADALIEALNKPNK